MQAILRSAELNWPRQLQHSLGKELFLEVILKMSPNRLGPPMLNISINPDLQPPARCGAIHLHYFHRRTFLQHGWLTGKGFLFFFAK